MRPKPTLRRRNDGWWVNQGKVRWNVTIHGKPFGPPPGTVYDWLDGPFPTAAAAYLHALHTAFLPEGTNEPARR